MKLEMYSVPEYESAALRLSNLQNDQERGNLRALLEAVEKHGPMTPAEATHYSGAGNRRTRDMLAQGVREGYLEYTEGRKGTKVHIQPHPEAPLGSIKSVNALPGRGPPTDFNPIQTKGKRLGKSVTPRQTIR